MALSDPQSITIATVANSLPRTSTAGAASVYTKDDGLVKLSVAHSTAKKGGRVRHTVRVDHSKVAADPFQSTLNAKYSMSAYVVIDVPPVGYTAAEQKQILDGFTAWLANASNATKVLGGES